MSETFRVDTPESVDLALEPAGLGTRFLAILIDALIQWGAALLILFLVLPLSIFNEARYFSSSGWLGGHDTISGILMTILLLSVGFLFFLYKLLLEAFWNGQTVGKRAVGIRVIKANGLPVDFLQVVIRNLLRVVDYLPMQYLVGSVAIIASKRGQRLGDMVAGTVVVRDQRPPLALAPVRLFHQPTYDLNLLREHVLRLPDEDLEPARRFWMRRMQLTTPARWRVGARIAESLARRMGWQEPLPPHPEMFIEAALFVRAQ
ncbi:MAG TPA: RDD family protein [Symbiobacteriaceae bacterium]|nr:RDD family protein [Symbiobacteriaceae bacterium]